MAQTQRTLQHDTAFIRNVCTILFTIEVLLGIAHCIWPEYRWGQGRRSYFNLANRLTLASWLGSIQLVAVAGLAVAAFHKERRLSWQEGPPADWRWLAGALPALALSFIEFSRPHHRFSVLGLPAPDLYQQFVILPLWIGTLALFGWFLLSKLRRAPRYRKFGAAWLAAWGVQFIVTVLQQSGLLLSNWMPQTTLIRELAFLSGGTFLLLAVGAYALGAAPENRPADVIKTKAIPFPQERQMLLLLGVGGMTFSIIFLEIVLFQILTIFGDLLTANSVISIAMLGISIGGLVGFFSASSVPLQAMIGAGLLLPVSVILALGAPVSLPKNILAASVLLTLPFVCASTVVTVVLARMKTHIVYFVDLLGAAAAALVIGGAFTYFREESSILFLGAFTCLTALCFAWLHPKRLVRGALVVLLLACAAGFITVGGLNLDHDGLNIVRVKLKRRMPQAEILFSKSSFVGRYDVVRKRPGKKSLSTYNNGRIIDTVRNRPAENYQIDPRLPHTLMEDPVILILGLSGDGITKTARTLGRKVYGVEINPAVVELQTNELVKYNAHSYQDIEVAVMDGRSYVEQSRIDFDMITLMNAHSARGRTSGRGPSPEYLHTYEAMQAYLERLTDRGVVIVEEPVSNPRREPPIWK
ncbi:MAG: hypothetical protein JRK53_26990, partial [Deltaproteobacteria bacterium]|nr:hypothetical protein [Deltaproteobacteria bacterium]